MGVNVRVESDEGMELAELALEIMKQKSVSPTAANYAIFIEHVTGAKPNLSDELLGKLELDKIDQAFLDDLHDRHFTFKDMQDAISTTGNAITGQLGSVIASLEAAEKDTVAYGEALAGATGELSDATDIDSVKRMVQSLVTATAHMQRRSQDLERKLQATTKEVQSLKGNLAEVRQEAMTDALTGVANRKLFDESMRFAHNEATKNGNKFSLILCDIDYFKRFNDTWGHQTGDQVIRFVASCMSRFSKKGHTVARYGGEEFAIVLPHTSMRDAQVIAEKVRATVESKKLLRKSTNEDLGNITVSLGVSRFCEGETVASFIERCDSNLYKSKQNGRNKTTTDDDRSDTKAA